MNQQKQSNSFFWPQDRSLDSVKSLYGPGLILFIFRCCMFGFCLSIQIYNWQQFGLSSFTFLTIQSATTCMVFWGLIIIEFILYKIRKDKPIPMLWKITQIIYQIVQSFQLPIVIMFWGFLNMEATFEAVCDHGIWMVALQVDFFLNRIQFKLNHSIFVLIYFLIALSINAIVSLTNEPVYDIVNYKDLMSYVFILLIAVFIFGNFFLCLWLQTLFKTKKIAIEDELDEKQQLLQQKDPEIQNSFKKSIQF